MAGAPGPVAPKQCAGYLVASTRTTELVMEPIRTAADIDHTFRHIRLAAVVCAWSNHGVFNALADGEARRLEELPGDPRALLVTARILGHAGLLVRRGERWALSPEGLQLQQSGALAQYESFDFFKDLSRVGEVLASGKPLNHEEGKRNPSNIGVNLEEKERSRRFLQMLYRRSEQSARLTARWVHDALGERGRVLDLGGGHGRYARELAELGHEATLFDFPMSIDLAKELHGDALRYIGGDFFEHDLGGGYDAIIASNIVHGLSPDRNITLLKRAAEALAPGGIVVLKDMFFDRLGMWPPSAAFFGLTMLMYTEAGDTYGLDEVDRWLVEAGLQPQEPVVYEGFSLAIGRKR